ncbi:hypothetical protein FRUB_02971 [Fimbriiglobus ruber]|uniref:Uncharacterized protein n=2 Tax=Fimbriiglobus ruber TaxID=1908690 RepID=A0A225DPP9_9BACT|nr:hypothetical protein FRUB_02971 [Fimbriiglobus ruber]
MPPNDKTEEWLDTLAFGAGKVRFDDNRPLVAGNTGKLIARKMVFASDGRLSRYHFPEGASVGPDGFIKQDKKIPFVRQIDLAPLTMTVRGMSPDTTYEILSQLAPTGRTQALEGTACAEYKFTQGNHGQTEFWLDPKVDYLPRRIQITHRDGSFDRLDIQYSPHDVVGWIPTTWNRTRLSSSGKILISVKATVERVKINAPIPDSDFEIQFQ